MLASRLCLRAATRPYVSKTSVSSSLRHQPLAPTSWHTRRIFATTPRHRKSAVARIQNAQQEVAQNKQEAEESIKPEGVKPETAAQPATKNDPLLSEQTVSNKEQRKADWAIIKDMAHYLWPKDDFGTRFRVSLSVGLLIGAKVRSSAFPIHRVYVDSIYRSLMSKSHFTSRTSWTA